MMSINIDMSKFRDSHAMQLFFKLVAWSGQHVSTIMDTCDKKERSEFRKNADNSAFFCFANNLQYCV